MCKKWYLTLLIVLLVATFALLEHAPSHVFAASSKVSMPVSFSHPLIHYTDYSDGYQAGVNDCQNQASYHAPYWQGQEYTNGYHDGYSFCQSMAATSFTQQDTNGYHDGYNSCHQYHSHFPPMQHALDQTYNQAFQRGYQDCLQEYGY